MQHHQPFWIWARQHQIVPDFLRKQWLSRKTLHRQVRTCLGAWCTAIDGTHQFGNILLLSIAQHILQLRPMPLPCNHCITTTARHITSNKGDHIHLMTPKMAFIRMCNANMKPVQRQTHTHTHVHTHSRTMCNVLGRIGPEQQFIPPSPHPSWY